MNQINPFDNLYFKTIGQPEGISSPSKIDETNSPAKSDESKGINDIPQTNENDCIDTSNMVDDTNGLNSSDLEQNQDNKNQDEIKEEVSQFVNDLLEKQN